MMSCVIVGHLKFNSIVLARKPHCVVECVIVRCDDVVG